MKRYALLDTDFISKTHSVQDDGGNHLIDRVMELPEYEFFCHAQTIFYKGIMPSEKILDLPVDCNFLTGSVNL